MALLGAARGLLAVVEQRMTRGPIEGPEARAGLAMFTALSETVAALADLDVVQTINSVLRLEGTTE